MALEADGDCVGLEAYLNSVDGSVEGFNPIVDLADSEGYQFGIQTMCDDHEGSRRPVGADRRPR